ncbi:hypothetical protein F4802DRAFT_560156 [Xylaria palmicola]|nr:hypothetical protein F4802DRAFT_560156 [Xylaria palmicola]
MMAGRPVAGSVAKLTRSISVLSQPTTILTSSRAATPLSRKYADLLKERNTDPDHPRQLYTRSSNLPHPKPKTKPLMQTFSSTAAREPAFEGMDNIVFPGSAVFDGATQDPFSGLIPLLPENPDIDVAPVKTAVFAANPEVVLPTTDTMVEWMGTDKSTHDAELDSRTLTDIWKGLVDDALDHQSTNLKFAL